MLKKLNYAISQLKSIDPLLRKLNYLSLMVQEMLPPTFDPLHYLDDIDIKNFNLEKINLIISKNDLMFTSYKFIK